MTQLVIAAVNQKLIKFRNKHHLEIDIDSVRLNMERGRVKVSFRLYDFCSIPRLSVQTNNENDQLFVQYNFTEIFRKSSLTRLITNLLFISRKLWVKVN